MQLTLGQVLDRLYAVHNDLTAAHRALARHRDAEVEAKEALRIATARAMLSEDCPRPRRGENGVTVADRDAWVGNHVAVENMAAEVAEATRKSAEDYLRVVRDQASLVQSMSAAMRAEMQLAGSPHIT